jgi:tetratricopeptide (TPR) repeat protein
LGPQHPAVASSLSALARLSDLGGQREEAEQLAVRALEILEGTLGPEHPALADSLELVAGLREASEEGEGTVALLERALRIREDALGWTHSTVAPVLDTLGRQSLAGADYGQAVELLQRALAIDERFYGEHHTKVGDALFTLARAYHAAEDYEQATASLERALSIQTDAFGSKHQAVIDTTIQLAACYERQDQTDKAARLRTQANELAQQKAVDDLTAIGNAIVNYAIDKGKYPTTTEIDALKRLLHPAYIRSMPLVDGWGNAYTVQSTASSYTLRCLGKDGRADSGRGGATTGFDADVILTDGQLTQWPESSRR